MLFIHEELVAQLAAHLVVQHSIGSEVCGSSMTGYLILLSTSWVCMIANL